MRFSRTRSFQVRFSRSFDFCVISDALMFIYKIKAIVGNGGFSCL